MPSGSPRAMQATSIATEGERFPDRLVGQDAAPPRDRWSHPSRPLPAAAAAAVYTAVVAVLARGVLAHLDTSIIGRLDGDNFWYAWSAWYFRQALLTGHDPNYTNQLRALTTSVPVFTDGFFNQLVAVPLQSVLTALGAYDVVNLLSYVLAGLTMYLLVSAFTRSWVACLVAGMVFTFSTYHFGRGGNNLGLVTIEWLPFCAWRLILFVREPRWRNAILAGVAVGLVPWAGVYYGAYFLVTFGIGLLVAVAVTDRRWFLRAPNLAGGVVVLVVGGVVALPSVYAYVAVPTDIQASVSAGATRSAMVSLSANLASFFLPDPYNPLFGSFTLRHVPLSPFPVHSEFLGLPGLTLAFACFCFRRGRTRVALAWLALAIVATVLALGPEMHVAHRYVTDVWVYQWVFGLPPLTSFRAPAVLGVVASMAVSVLAGLGAAELMATLGRGRRSRGIVAVALVGLVAIGLMPSTVGAYGIASFQVPVPDLYRTIAASPDDGLLLDLPTYIASAQFMQAVHHKRLVGGILPREPSSSLTAIDQVPYLWLLDTWQPVPESDTAIGPGVQFDVFRLPPFVSGLRANGISWVVLHHYLCVDPAVNSAWYCPELPHYDELRRFLRNTLGEPFADNVTAAGLTAWRVADAPIVPVPDVSIQLGSGWAFGLSEPAGAEPQRLMRGSAGLFIDSQRPGTAHLVLRASSYLRPMRLEVLLDGATVGTADLPRGVPTRLDLGTVPLARGRNVLELRSAQGCVQDGPDKRNCWSFAVQGLDLTAT